MSEGVAKVHLSDSLIKSSTDEDIDPIEDIIDYLVRCAKISFKNSHVDEDEIRTSENIRLAHESYIKSPANFLTQYGKYMCPQHINYFDSLKPTTDQCNFRKCVDELKVYHSDESRRKRKRNRRFRALQKLQQESDYFSEKEMMYRNPLLYEQLVGQFMTNEEVRARDNIDRDNLSLLNLVLETVDRNEMREIKEQQSLSEIENMDSSNKVDQEVEKPERKRWGEFDEPENKPRRPSTVHHQTMITAPERQLLKDEFVQEMHSSFIEGRDLEIDYNSIDNDDQYDDLLQVSRDAEDKYFDSVTNDVDSLEQHMSLVVEYGKKDTNDSPTEDSLDVFMKHLNKRRENI